VASRRRAFAAAVVAALAGCAGTDRDRQDRSTDGSGARTTGDGAGAAAREAGPVPSPESGSFQDPFDAWIPDLTVVNHDTDGMTAYVRVTAEPWGVSTFEETLSIRGHAPGRDPVSASVTTVDAESPRSVLAVLTADGRRGRQRYRGGGAERGVFVHVYEDAVGFEREVL